MAPFGNKSTSSKIKSLLTVTIERIKILKNRTSIVAKQSREDVVKLLQKGQADKALQRVDHVVREENMVAAYELLITNCQTVIARIECIKAKDACHPDIREAFATMIYAAPRCGELKELYEVRDILRTRYPNEFSTQVLDHKPEEKVNPQIIHNLSAKTPSLDLRIKLVKQIATEANIDWKYEAPPQRPRQNEEEQNWNATSDNPRSNPVTRVQDGAKVKNTEYDSTSRGSEEVMNRHEIKTVQQTQQINSSISAPSRHVAQSAATLKKDVADYSRRDSENVINRHGVNMVQQSKHETSPVSAPSRNVQGTDTNSRRGLKDRNPVSSPDQSSGTSCVDDLTEKTMRTPVHIDHSKVEVLENSTTRSSSKSNRNKKKVDLEAVEAALQAASDAADAATYALEMVRTHSLKRREKMLSRKVSSLSGKSFSSISGNDAVESPTSRSRFQDGQDTTESPITRGRLQDEQFSKFSKDSRGTDSPLKMRQKSQTHNSEVPKFDDYDSDESTARNFPIRQVKDKPQNHGHVFQKPTTNNLIAGKSIVSELSQDNACFENDAESKFHGKKYVANNNTQREGFHQLSYQRSRTPSKVVKGTEYSEYSEEESPNQWSIKEDDMDKTTQYKMKSSNKAHVFSHRNEELNEVQQKFIYRNHTEGLDRSKVVSKSTHRYKAEHEMSEITRSSRGSNFDYSDEAESEFKLSFTKSREDKFATPASDYVKGTLMMNNYYESSPEGKDNYRRPVNRKLQWQSLTSEELDVFNYDDDQPSVIGSTKADGNNPRFDSSPTKTAARNPYEQNSAQNFSNKVFDHKLSAPLHQQQATVMEPHKLAVKSVRTRAPRRQIDQ